MVCFSKFFKPPHDHCKCHWMMVIQAADGGPLWLWYDDRRPQPAGLRTVGFNLAFSGDLTLTQTKGNAVRCLSTHVVLTGNGVLQMSWGQVSISICWCVCCSFHDNAKLPWKVNGPKIGRAHV